MTSSSTIVVLLLKYIVIIQLLLLPIITTTNALKVAVFGGSGFIGRRVCRDLVVAGCDVLCISRSPPPTTTYSVKNFQWVQYNYNNTSTDDMLLINNTIDAAISCVGNVRPSQKWKGLWGLGFDDDQLRYDNGDVNEQICHLTKKAGAKRFVYVSVSYEVAKMVEGPIVGYMDGKRNTEHVACQLFGNDNTIVVGPSLVYGGKRFPTIGKFYRALVESPPAQAYVRGNDWLRKKVSMSMQEDWVEKTIFSSPVDVNVVSRVLSAGAMGLITRDMMFGHPRRQGFYDTNGQPVTYDDVIYADGTAEIERVNQLVTFPFIKTSNNIISNSNDNKDGPPLEGALIGTRPYLYPFPVIAIFSYLFWAVATQQFVQISG
mmetsp:Transcript_7294/g.11491  ORF Transcript_7294/g.11491 Transcript_7294/m.11491 type:complete len:374 (-) Transcript_7294:22-1143(-)